MLLLQCSQKLLTLYKSLAGSIPESLKVSGSLYYINHGNPFNVEVLVESWPEYQTVIIRPQTQEMTKDTDPYTNVYHIFSEEPQELQEVLKHCGVIKWKQMLQIQGTKSEAVTVVLKDPNFKFSQLDVSYSTLVNDSWDIGQNEKSLHYIQHCIQTLIAFCLQGPEGGPVTWVTMVHSCEVGMKNIPFYLSVLGDNEKSHRSVERSGFSVASRGCHQWICSPGK
ncbi:LOW QUALITY PROTEIN: glycine N-acyltransferase-like protein 1 [Callospermophilus lateralis]